jgi:hypothetical protein
MIIDYKVSSFLYFIVIFVIFILFHMYTSLFDCRYKCVSKCKSIKVNYLGHNSFIRSEFEVHEHLMESLFDKL